MTFVCTLYVLIVVFAENKGKSHSQCVSVFKEAEVVHLSPQSNLSECSQLMKGANELIPERMKHDKTNYDVPNEDLDCSSTTSKVYLVDLKRWTNDYPNRIESEGRSTMELTRKLLEYSDLVMYMKENERPVNFLDTQDYYLTNMLEFPQHKVTRRRTLKNEKHLSRKGKKEKKKRVHKEHSKHSKPQKKGIHGPAGHAIAHKIHKLRKKENKLNEKKCYLKRHQSLYISILFVLIFIILCLLAAYYLHRRSRLKARGTRFKYNWARNKEDKDTLTDYIEWKDEAVCSCSDVDIGNAIKCPLCNRFYQTASDICDKYLNSVGVQKSKDKGKKKRFSFLQKSFQDKKNEKNLENRDWKKADRKAALKKQEKLQSSIQGDQQCACCKCNLHIQDKIIREKQEHKKKVLQKLKAKTRKDKKRKKNEIRKAEKYAGTCFKDTCK